MTQIDETRPYADPDHPGNKIRPRVRCLGCGVRGCTTAWGPWCLACNVERIDRINGRFDKFCALARDTDTGGGE